MLGSDIARLVNAGVDIGLAQNHTAIAMATMMTSQRHFQPCFIAGLSAEMSRLDVYRICRGRSPE